MKASPTDAADGSRAAFAHDFRGPNLWGHALHAWTWKAIPATKRNPPRGSFMVHTQRYPEVGDLLIFNGQSGVERTVRISAVEQCSDPRDMFTITVDMVEIKPLAPAHTEGRQPQ